MRLPRPSHSGQSYPSHSTLGGPRLDASRRSLVGRAQTSPLSSGPPQPPPRHPPPPPRSVFVALGQRQRASDGARSSNHPRSHAFRAQFTFACSGREAFAAGLDRRSFLAVPGLLVPRYATRKGIAEAVAQMQTGGRGRDATLGVHRYSPKTCRPTSSAHAAGTIPEGRALLFPAFDDASNSDSAVLTHPRGPISLHSSQYNDGPSPVQLS
ncbi:uncharacterized protein B0H18DRAFT_1036976 [Fomitopsis serialis]|uniref:uncharacterized protein n=1 Tax=Fomitopsis serialis TaxID=139415 RepID=UPI002007CC05|nr:uncharacterized protein B0H18DRAFT_1036976 [Neoantrodia serialis]KAH9916834.1 hypothetical protein B0H18DRAFT_1036976 [Neoantrodia serialis]